MCNSESILKKISRAIKVYKDSIFKEDKEFAKGSISEERACLLATMKKRRLKDVDPLECGALVCGSV